MINNMAADLQFTAADLCMQEEQNTQMICATEVSAAPKNTTNALIPKQKEFIRWATQMNYQSPETVTEAKLAYFLTTQVLGRKNKSNASWTIGKATVNQYITALTSLWKIQVEAKVNSNSTPRGPTVKAIQKNLERTTFQTRRANFDDRGKHYQHLLTNEHREHIILVSEFFWNSPNSFAGLRNRVGHLMCEHGLLRGETVRDVELPDFFCVPMDNEGPTTCNAMVIIKGHGKMNQFGKVVFSGYYHHSNVRICCQSAIALLLFYRFQIAGETPDFSKSENWYTTAMFATSPGDNKKAVSKSAHADAIAKAHKTLKIITLKVTHGGRLFGRQKLEEAGVDKVSTDVLGGWATGAGEGCHGNGLSRPGMRALAGFPPRENIYYLPRACIQPKQELAQMVFPFVEDWERRNEESDGCEPNLALKGFLRLLKSLQTVILQDTAVTMDEYPHEVYNHLIFKSAAFLEYKTELLAAIAERSSVDPINDDIQRVMPQLCRQISVANENLTTSIVGALSQNTTIIVSNIKDGFSEIKLAQAGTTSAFTSFRDALKNNFLNSAAAMTDSLPANNASHQETLSMQQQQELAADINSTSAMPEFYSVLRQTTEKITDVWAEWTIGLNGRPSVQDTDLKFKTAWRRKSGHQKIYSRQKMIIKLINNNSERKAISCSLASQVIEEKRLENRLPLLHVADNWKDFESKHLI